MSAPESAAVTPGIEVTHEPEIPVQLVQLWLCDLCLDGEGDECHTPGCSLWIHDVPKPGLRNNQGVTILGPALEPFMTREQFAARQPQPAPGDLPKGHFEHLQAIGVADNLRSQLRETRHALASLLDRCEGSNVLTDDEADEYRRFHRSPEPEQPAPELSGSVVRVISTAPGEALAADNHRLRELVEDILSHFGASGSGHTARVGQVQIAKWRKRAGLPS